MPPQPKKRPPLSEITKRFHLPLLKAAEDLGICQTLLKKFCRQYGINRWPYRKIKSLFMQGPNPSEQIQMNNKVQAYVDSSLEDEEIESEDVLDEQLKQGSINPHNTQPFTFAYPVPQPPVSPFVHNIQQQQQQQQPPIQASENSSFFFQTANMPVSPMMTKLSPAMSQVVQNISQQHFGHPVINQDASAHRKRSRTVAVAPSQDKKLLMEQQQQQQQIVAQQVVSPPTSPRIQQQQQQQQPVMSMQQQQVPNFPSAMPHFKLEDTNVLYTSAQNSALQKQKSWGGFPSNFHQKQQEQRPISIEALIAHKPMVPPQQQQQQQPMLQQHVQPSPVQSLFTMAQGPTVIPTKAPSPTQDEVMPDPIPLRREKRSRSILGAAGFKEMQAQQQAAQMQQQQEQQQKMLMEQQQQLQQQQQIISRTRSPSLNNGTQPQQPQQIVQPPQFTAQHIISSQVQPLNSANNALGKVPPISTNMNNSFFGNAFPDKSEPKEMDQEITDAAVPSNMPRVRRARTVAVIGHHPLQRQNSGLQPHHLPKDNSSWEQVVASRVSSPTPSVGDAPPSPLSNLHTSLAASLPHQNSPVHSPAHSPPVMSPIHSPLSTSPVMSYMPMAVPKQDSNVMRSKSHGTILQGTSKSNNNNNHSYHHQPVTRMNPAPTPAPSSGGFGFKLPSLSELLGSIERHVHPTSHQQQQQQQQQSTTSSKAIPKASLKSYKL